MIKILLELTTSQAKEFLQTKGLAEKVFEEEMTDEGFISTMCMIGNQSLMKLLGEKSNETRRLNYKPKSKKP